MLALEDAFRRKKSPLLFFKQYIHLSILLFKTGIVIKKSWERIKIKLCAVVI